MRQQHKLLIVDDDQKILKALERVFLDEPYGLGTASGGEEALATLHEGRPTIVISDQMMPGMNGIELLGRIREESPDTLGILLTGQADMAVAVAAINSGVVYKYVPKPWDDEQLKVTVKRAVEQYELVLKNRALTEKVSEQNEELKYLNTNLEKRIEEKTEEIREKNTQLQTFNEQLKKNFVDTTRVFAALVEMRDEYIGGHSKRVAVIAKEIAGLSGLAEEEVFDIEVAALLHDIGKIGLRDDFLKVPDASFSYKESLELQEQHAVMGQMSLLGIDGLHEVARIIRHHHERYDGTGVPDRLKGKEIPIGSRIIAAIDAFDGLRFRRDARRSVTMDAACESLKKLAGSRYDPAVIEKLVQFLSGLHRRETSKNAIKITTSGLREDMVLARDIVSGSNMLLVARGEKLKRTYLDKIRFYVEKGLVENEFYVLAETNGKGRTARASSRQ